MAAMFNESMIVPFDKRCRGSHDLQLRNDLFSGWTKLQHRRIGLQKCKPMD